MPIKQIERRIEQHATTGFVALGSVNKGGVRTEEMIRNNQPGPDLDYFRVEFYDYYAHYESVFRSIYGDKPTVFDPVLILGNNPAMAFENWRVMRDLAGKRIARRCDGEYMQMWYDAAGVRHDTKYEAIDPLPCRAPGACKECAYDGRLYLVFPEFYALTKLYGYFMLRTGSQADIAHISAALANWHPVAQNLDSFAFSLRREPKHDGWRTYTNKQGQQKTTEVVKNLLVLEPSKFSGDKIQNYLASQTSTMPSLVSGVGVLPDARESTALAVRETSLDEQRIGREASGEEDEDVQDAAFDETLSCHSVYVQFDKKSGQYWYVLRCDGAHNFTLATTDYFDALGMDTSKWQANGKVIPFDPPLVVTVDELDNVTAVEYGK